MEENPIGGNTCVIVKQEKIDPEIEQKIKDHIKIKEEPPDDRSCTTKQVAGSSDSNSSNEEAEDADAKAEPEDKKNVELVKSSNELLLELFQVFNASPPEELLNDDDLLKKSQNKSKKHKKEKSKKRKRHKGEDAGDGSIPNGHDIKKEKHKHKKKKKHKNKDQEKKKSSSRSKSKDKEHENISSKETESTKADRSNESRIPENSSRKRHAVTESTSEPPAKLQITHEKPKSNSFYNGCKERDLKTASERKRRSSERSRKQQCNSKDHSDKNNMSDISLSDEETYLRERERLYSSNSLKEHHHQPRYQTKNYGRSRRSADRHHRHSRSRSRKRSRSRDLGIDKKRLLEIARKNAISMFKRGNLPGCANMSEDVKDKVLLQMRYGGRTVQDLTDFCRKISNGEPLSSMSSDNDSDVDKDGNTKAFHNPFQLKEREPIVLQLRNAKSMVPAVASAPKKEDLTKAITMQFPVSSGQQHRISESWTPVEPKPLSVTPLPSMPTATQSTPIFKIQKNVFEKPLPAADLQEPAFKPLTPSEPFADTHAPKTAETNSTDTHPTLQKIPNPVPPLPVNFVPDVPIPSSNVVNSVFPETTASFDVSSIISKRLSALRRLQENPMDSEAIKMVYNSQKEMSSWASSKHLPGQFTGSTGVNVLKAHELNSGRQVWARRDQLKSANPLTGGMGMHLLQKMGWKPGEGLGREKTGALQPLLLDVKLDKRGLVAKDDHTVANGVRNIGGGGGGGNGIGANAPKKRPNNINDATQNLQNKHPVCILNELTSKRKWTPPLYELVSEGGPSHSKKFLFSVSMNGQTYTPPEGSNTKKEAKMLAAKFCLEQIGVLPPTH